MILTDRVSSSSASPRDLGRDDLLHRSVLTNPADRDVSTMKILIVSLVKTGNTWVKQLLSTIYDLPIVFAGNTLDAAPETLEGVGERWIAHQHWALTPALIRWGSENGIVFVTTIRHPGDTLVSLYHYLRNYADVFQDLAGDFVTLMNLDRIVLGAATTTNKKIGKHLLWYVEERYRSDLESALRWMHAPQTLSVRYEDLWRDPFAGLTKLTDRISPVARDVIERAIESCDIGLMRSLADRDRHFFRQGGVGGWRTELPSETLAVLPSETLAVLRKVEPYPTYAALMGYTFEPDDPLTTAPAKERIFHSPFRGMTHFDNGVPIAPLLVRLYLSVPSAVSARWVPISSTASDHSFFAWANARADNDPSKDPSLPAITNLAAYIYRTRSDMQRSFPDLFGADRRAYARWFVVHAHRMYTLDRAFIAPVLEGIRDWLNAPAQDDPRRDEAALAITTIARYLYDLRRDLHTVFPDPFGQHRLPLARWFVDYGRAEFSLDDGLAPLTTMNAAPASAQEDQRSLPYEWMETLRLTEEMLAAEREATHHYVTALQQDRNNIHHYLLAVEEDRNKIRDYLVAVEEDRKNVRDYLASVEEDRSNIRAYLASVEEDRGNLREYLMAVEQDRSAVRKYLVAVEEDRNNLRQYLASVEEDRSNVRRYLVGVEEDRNNVRANQEDTVIASQR